DRMGVPRAWGRRRRLVFQFIGAALRLGFFQRQFPWNRTAGAEWWRLDWFAWLRSRLPRPIEVLILDQKKPVVADLVSPSLIGGADRLAGDGIHELMSEPVAGPRIHLSKRDTIGRRDGRVEGNRTGNE